MRPPLWRGTKKSETKRYLLRMYYRFMALAKPTCYGYVVELCSFTQRWVIIMILQALLISALLLAIERVVYIWVWHRPDSFRVLCRKPGFRQLGDEPVDVLHKFFYVFKAIQISVFAGWILVFSEGVPLPTAGPVALILGIVLMVAGQFLNMSVFQRLGKVGVFYGNKLGHEVPWVQGFPFSVVPHPQYTGTAISIWGLFLVMRYPNPDWIVLPILQTVYYLIAMRYEG